MRINIKQKKGQSLVEILIAVSILVVAILGTLALLNRALGLNRVVAEHYTATYLAAEGLELVKNLFDKTFFEVTAANGFYGWVDPCIIPASTCALAKGKYGIYVLDYDDSALTVLEDCEFSAGNRNPTPEEVSEVLFNCQDSNFDYLKSLDNFYSDDPAGKTTKFKRIIIIDWPEEFDGVAINLDYRVTSAVGWETRGGKFVVQLQDHFLPWRIP